MKSIAFLDIIFTNNWVSNRQVFLFVLLSVLVGLLDLIATVSLLPVIVLHLKPQVVLSNSYFVEIFGQISIEKAAAIILFVSLFFFVSKFGATFIKQKANSAIIKELLCNAEESLVRKLLHANIRKFNGATSKKWLDFISYEGGSIIKGFSSVFLEILSDIIVLIIFLTVGFFIIGPLIIGLTIFGFSIVLLGIVYFSKKVLKYKAMNKDNRRNVFLERIAKSWVEVKLYNIEEHVFKFFSKYNRQQKNMEMQIDQLRNFPPLLLDVSFFSSIALCISAITVWGNFISATNIGLIAMISFRLVPLFNKISRNLNQFTQIAPRLDFITSSLNRAANLSLPPHSPEYKLGFFQGCQFQDYLEMVDVCYVHQGQKGRTLDYIQLKISKGDFCVISGPSGSGKSTLSEILCGIRESTRGRYVIDGRVVTANSISHMKNILTYVSASPFLFDGTLLENITLCEPSDNNINEERLNHAVEYCSLEEIVQKKDGGFLQPINVEQDNLSTGEKKRIVLARALYQRREIYIFDEPTANLNAEYAEKFFKFFSDIEREATIVVITHNSDAITSEHRRFHLNEGKLTEIVSEKSFIFIEKDE